MPITNISPASSNLRKKTRADVNVLIKELKNDTETYRLANQFLTRHSTLDYIYFMVKRK